MSENIDNYPSADQLGWICYFDKTLNHIGEYRITPEDAEYLARMIDGETWGQPSPEDASMMLWTLAQRKRIGKFTDWSLKRLTQAYSQPINSIWLRTGRMCRAFYPKGDKFVGDLDDYLNRFIETLEVDQYHAYGLKTGWEKETVKKRLKARWPACQEKKVDRRHRNINVAEWSDLAVISREITLKWASGEELRDAHGGLLPRKPAAIGWFAPSAWKHSQKGRKRQGLISGNVYYANESWAKTEEWTEEMTVVVPPDSMCPDYLGSPGS